MKKRTQRVLILTTDERKAQRDTGMDLSPGCYNGLYLAGRKRRQCLGAWEVRQEDENENATFLRVPERTSLAGERGGRKLHPQLREEHRKLSGRWESEWKMNNKFAEIEAPHRHGIRSYNAQGVS